MCNAYDLNILTREVLGKRASALFLKKMELTLAKDGDTAASLGAAARKIQNVVKLFISEERADILGRRYKDYFRNNPSRL